MRNFRLLIVCCIICFTIQLFYTACTYDYFDDETNYIVFVPEVKAKRVDGCRVMVYDKSGRLVGDKSTLTTSIDAKLQEGLFTFRLPVGDYSVYCYTNIQGVSFADEGTHETSVFSLPAHEEEEAFAQPSDLFFDKLEHTVQHPGIVTTDTVAVKRYVGRITVRFKNFPFDISNLSHVHLAARGVASTQYLKHDTLTTSRSSEDLMRHTDDLSSVSFAGDVLEVDHRYFPSVVNNYKTLEFSFLDANGEQIARMPVGVAHPDTNIPMRLYYGRRLIIEVDRYLITRIQLVGWDEDIKSGGDIGVW